MSITPGPAWIFMFFLVLLVFGAIAAIIWRSWIVGIIVLFLLLVAGGLLYSFRVGPMMIEQSGAMLSDESGSNDDILKTADIYPSLQDAAKYAAIRVYDNIQLARPALRIKRIRILSSGKEDVRAVVAQVFRDRYPGALIVADDSHPGETFEMIVTAQIEDGNNGKCLNLTAA